jgi:hypothetical protein
MAKMGRIVTVKIGRLEKKAFLRFLDDSIKGLEKEKERLNPKEFELARKTMRHILKKIRKTEHGEECALSQPEYDFLKTSLEKIVEHNKTAFSKMFFLKRWLYQLLSKNYEHLLNVVTHRK